MYFSEFLKMLHVLEKKKMNDTYLSLFLILHIFTIGSVSANQ